MKTVYDFTKAVSIVVHGELTIASTKDAWRFSSLESTCESARIQSRNWDDDVALPSTFLGLNWSTRSSKSLLWPYKKDQRRRRVHTRTQTLSFSCNALLMNATNMSRLNCSPCLTREFVAIGRCASDSKGSAPCPVDLVGDGDLAYFSMVIFWGCSMNLVVGVYGPDLGVRWLNCECVEWGSISTQSVSGVGGDRQIKIFSKIAIR